MRKFRVTNFEDEYEEKFGCGREIGQGSIVTLDEVNRYCNWDEDSWDRSSFMSVEGFNNMYLTQIEEVFDDEEEKVHDVDDNGNRLYTVDELEEDIEYSLSNDNSNSTQTYVYKIDLIDGNRVLLLNYNNAGYSQCGLSYNTVAKGRFTVAPQPIHLTFDEAKADCIENGTEYIGKVDVEHITDIAMKPCMDGISLVFNEPKSRIILDSRRTWVKKEN